MKMINADNDLFTLRMLEDQGIIYIHPDDTKHILEIKEIPEEYLREIRIGDQGEVKAVVSDSLDAILEMAGNDIEVTKAMFHLSVSDAVDGTNSRLILMDDGSGKFPMRFDEDNKRCCYTTLQKFTGLTDEQMLGVDWEPYGRDMTCSIEDMSTLLVMADLHPITDEDLGIKDGEWAKATRIEDSAKLMADKLQKLVERDDEVFSETERVLIAGLVLAHLELLKLKTRIEILEK